MPNSVFSIRSLAEFLLGQITVRRTLPDFVGGGIVVANARIGGLRYLFRFSSNLDPYLFAIARTLVRPGFVVWDIGGNVGLFAAAASGLSGSSGMIYSVEADSDACNILHKTASAQPKATHAKITVLNSAISDRCGLVSFCIARRSRSANFIYGFGSTQTGGVLEVRNIPALTLDSLLGEYKAPDLVKIDVEGAEALVLAGAEHLLSAVRPLLIIEVRKEVSDLVAEQLRKYEYRIYDGPECEEVPDGEGAAWETIAIPSENDTNLPIIENAN